MSRESPQLEMGFEIDEERKLQIVDVIEQLKEKVEGPMTPQHFAMLIESSIQHELGSKLSEDQKTVIRRTVEEASSRTKLDSSALAQNILERQQ